MDNRNRPAVPAMVVAACISVACHGRVSTSRDTAADLAAHVVDAGVGPLDDARLQEVERRLANLYRDASKDGDEAVVILMSFYLGEHNGEELFENVVARGPRMIPLLERYLNHEPTLVTQYPQPVRLERTTTVMFLNEALQSLRVQAGARRVAHTSVETAPLRQESGNCKVALVRHPELKFDDDLVQPGESYHGAPVLRINIEESGSTTNAQLLSESGVKRLDALVLTNVRQWKYAPRPHCGAVQANVVVTVDWELPRGG